MTTANPIRLPSPVPPPSIFTDRSRKTLTALIMLYLLVRGGMQSTCRILDLMQGKSAICSVWSGQARLPPVYKASFVFHEVLPFAVLGAGLLVWRRPSCTALAIWMLCATECVATTFYVLEQRDLLTPSGPLRSGRLWVLVPFSDPYLASAYVAWCLWPTRRVPVAVARLIGGVLLIIGATRGAGALVGIRDFWSLIADDLSPATAKLLWAGDQVRNWGAAAAGLWLVLARKGKGVGPASLLLLTMLAVFGVGMVPRITGYEWYRSAADLAGSLIGALTKPGLALAFLIFLLRYKPSPELGEPTCATCGYNLTGNVSGRCPECGEPIAGRGQQDARHA